MKIKVRVIQKVISVFSTFLLLVNSFTPYLLIVPTFSHVKAQDISVSTTSEPTPTDAVDSIPTPTSIPEPTLIPTETVSPTPTVEVTPISEPTITPVPIQTPSQWTFEKVELNKEYVAPQNSEVKLTFTKLPDPAGNVKIKEITLTTEQIKQTGSLSDKAYDITSDMKDGDFSYNLSLPIPESSKDKSVEVKFAEDILDIGSAEKVENALTKTDTSVSVASLDHMTIFVVSGASTTAAIISLVSILDPSWTAIGGGGVFSAYIGPPAYDYVSPGSTSVYDGRESGIIKAGLTVDPTSGVYEDEGLFGFKPTVTINTLASGALTYDVENQEGTNPVWMTIEIDTGIVDDRNDNTTYQFVPTTNPAGWHIVDAGSGQWQKWNNNSGDTTGNPLITLSAVASANTGKNVVRAYLRLGMGNSYHGTGSGTVAYVDKTTIGGVTYDFIVGSGSTPTSCTGALVSPPSGTTACYATIQAAINAASAGDTINVAAGTYNEKNIHVNKSITLLGDPGDASAGPGSNAPVIDGGSAYGDAILIDNNISDVTIKGFEIRNYKTIDGDFDGVGNAISAWESNTSNITIQDNYFHDLGYNGVLVGNDGAAGDHTNWTIKNNIIEKFGYIGFELTNTSNSSIEDNVIHMSNQYIGAIFSSARRSETGLTIKNNTIDGTASASYPTIYIYAYDLDVPNPNLNTVLIEGNTITSTGTPKHIYIRNIGTGTVTGVQIYNNTLASLQNRTNAMIDARNNTWSVSDPNNIDQIEAVISQNCTSSPYVHGVCDGGDSTSFGFVRYYDIETPTNSGWNLQSKSATSNETPLDVACGGYSKENSVAQNWTAVSGTNIKYQREVTFPSNAISNIEAGSNTYTPFSTFGSSTGTEGLWKTRVRAYVDANANNKYDSGEEVSGWSNECNITFDKTAPSVPVNGAPNNTSIPTNNFDFTWNASSDASPITYEFQSTLNPAQSGGVLTTGLWKSGTLTNNIIHSSGAPDGKWYWQVRATDSAGNTSAWSSIWNVTLDKIFPTVDLVFATPGPSATSFQAVFSENVVQSEAEDPANYFLNNWPGAGGSGDLAGDATIIYDSLTKTATVSFTNSSWYISPEQQWGTKDIHDLAGNLQNTNPYSEYSTLMIAPVTTDSGTDTNWHNTSVTVNFSCTDTGGSGCKNTYYTTDGTTPTTSSPSGNSVTLNTDGIYTIKYFSIDNSGNAEEVKTALNTVKIDKTAPGSPTVTSSSHILSTWNSDRTIDVAWDTSDFSGIAGYSYQWSVSPTTNPNNTLEETGTTNTSGNRATSESIYFHIKALDGAGNWSSVTHYGPFWVDANNPNGSWTTPIDGDYIKGFFNLEVAPTDVGSGIKHVVFKIKKTGGSFSNISTDTTSPYQGSLDTTSKVDGTYVLRAQIVDNVDRLVNKDINITIDNTIPVLSSQTNFEGWYNTNQTSAFGYSDTNGVVSGNDPTCDITTEGINQTCSVTPNVCDAAGNCNTTTVTSNGANIDKTNPSSTISTPTNNGTNSVVYSNSWSGYISGDAADVLSGINNVKVSIQKDSSQYFDGTNFITTGTEILLDTSYLSGSWNYAGLASPAQGSYTIKSHAIDNATNMESTYTLTIILDKTIPEVAISLNPANPDAQNGWYKTQPEVTLTATDTNIEKIEYQWNSKTGAWTTYSAPFKPGSEGAHILYYRAQDKADNYSDVGIKNIKWDKTELTDGPLNISISPNPTSGTTSVVKWEKADDNTGIDRYEVKWSLKDGNKTYMDAVGNSVREHTIDNLTEGVWNVYVTAFDGSGNSKNASADLTVDQTGPSAPQLSVLETDIGSVSLGWTKISEANNYIIWYGTTPGSYQYGAKVGDIQNYTVQGLGAGSYYFIVKSVDSSGNQSGNSNEVSTGAIVGAPGVTENTPAEGFAENVLGEATESANLTPTGTVLGTETKTGNNKKLQWWQWVLLSLFTFGGIFFGYKKWKK